MAAFSYRRCDSDAPGVIQAHATMIDAADARPRPLVRVPHPARRDVSADDEAVLLRALRRGEEAAFRRLFELHVDAVHRVAARIVGAGGDADDVVQETFVAAFLSIGSFGMRAAVRTWLHRIAVNFALKHKARRARAARAGEAGGEMHGEAPADPETLAGSRQNLDRLSVALEALDAKKREALLLHEVHGMTAQEIADTLGTPLSTVLSRIARGRREVGDRMGAKERA